MTGHRCATCGAAYPRSSRDRHGGSQTALKPVGSRCRGPGLRVKMGPGRFFWCRVGVGRIAVESARMLAGPYAIAWARTTEEDMYGSQTPAHYPSYGVPHDPVYRKMMLDLRPPSRLPWVLLVLVLVAAPTGRSWPGRSGTTCCLSWKGRAERKGAARAGHPPAWRSSPRNGAGFGARFIETERPGQGQPAGRAQGHPRQPAREDSGRDGQGSRSRSTSPVAGCGWR